MKIRIQTIQHYLQRYNTVGDWYKGKHDGSLNIEVSQMDNWRYEALIGIHELVEALLCIHEDITQEMVDAFDIAYDVTQGDGEPGDDPAAPYHRQHCIATGVERVLAPLFGVKWSDYERAIETVSGTWRGYNDQRRTSTTAEGVHGSGEVSPLSKGPDDVPPHADEQTGKRSS